MLPRPPPRRGAAGILLRTPTPPPLGCSCCRACHPTIAANNSWPHSRVALRSQLCAGHAGDPDFDIWMSAFEPCSQGSLAGTALCTGCTACTAGQRHLDWEQQSQFRYQLIVDGHGATYNSAVWKLLSKSMVVRLRPDGWDGPIFEQFYDPLVQQHVVHSNVSSLPAVLASCRRSPGACKRLARSARAAMRCLLRTEVLDDYLWGVFLVMHDAVHRPT
jgi:hypothetical protein